MGGLEGSEMEQQGILQAEHVTHRYDKDNIIEDVSLCLKEGEIVSLLGISGVGKTTLFHALSGLLPPTEGRILLEGEDITGKAGRVSYMLQKDMLLPYFTILDNIAMPKRILQLSGGMRQRAAFLRAYLFSGRVALLDEPFSALDAITKGEMHAWYLKVMEQIKMSVIFITHDIDEAILLSDRIYIMAGKPGKITAELIVDKAKPREREYALTTEFLGYKRDILGLLSAAGGLEE